MAKEEAFTVQGRVLEALANTHFRVKIDSNDIEIICHIAGKMRKNFIKIIPGDEVTIEMSPYDMTKGRIIYRGRPRPKYDESQPQTQIQHKPNSALHGNKHNKRK